MTKEFIWRVLEQNLATADLELQAQTGEGFEILDIGIKGGADDLVAKVIIGEENILCIPADAGNENMAPVFLVDDNIFPLIPYLREKFPDVPTPKVCPGEKIVISSGGAAGKAYLRYVHLLGGQVPADTDPGASRGITRLQLFHQAATWTIPAGATQERTVDINKNPSGFAAWVYPGEVPDGVDYQLLGSCTSKGAGSGPNISYDGIRMWKGEKAFLQKDQAYTDPNLFPYNVDTVRRPPFLLPEALTFVPSEKLKIEVKATNTGTTDETAEIFVTLIVLQVPRV